ncbi:MAG TPA: response regulator [Rubrobacteraceae bacterium]|nr:response regulator [Rubrobacteraceae bacterium]
MTEKNILIAMDKPDDVLLTLRALEKNGIDAEVVVASDGAEVLEYLRGAVVNAGSELGDEPNLVLLDPRLPKVDGLELLRYIRQDERTSSLRVVVLTSDERERGVIAEYGLRVDLFIEREVDFARYSREFRRLRPLLDGSVLPSGSSVNLTAGELA